MLKYSEDLFKENQDEILHKVCELYDTKLDNLKKLGSFESFVYDCARRPQSIIIKITHDSHRSMNMIRGELEWVNHLSQNDVSICGVVPTVNECDVEEIAVDGSSFFIYAFEKIEGYSCTLKDLTDDFVAQWGAVLGKMHRVTLEYQPSAAQYRRNDWLMENRIPDDPSVLDEYAITVERYNELIGQIQKLPQDKNSYNLIHSDLHYGNFLVRDGRIVVLDTDDSHYNWFVFDLMIPLYYALRNAEVDPDDAVFAEKFFRNLLRGYRQENAMQEWWLDTIPLFLKLREIDLFFILLTMNPEDMNDWCRRLLKERRPRIENRIPVIDLDFRKFI